MKVLLKLFMKVLACTIQQSYNGLQLLPAKPHVQRVGMSLVTETGNRELDRQNNIFGSFHVLTLNVLNESITQLLTL